MEIVAGERSCYTLLAFIALKMELHWRSNPIGKVRKNLPLWSFRAVRIYTKLLTLPQGGSNGDQQHLWNRLYVVISELTDNMDNQQLAQLQTYVKQHLSVNEIAQKLNRPVSAVRAKPRL